MDTKNKVSSESTLHKLSYDMSFVWFSVTCWILWHKLSLKWQKIGVISIFGMIPSVSLTFDLQRLFSICNPISLAIDFITLVVAMDYSNLANSHFLLNSENAIFCYHGNCFWEYLKMLKDAKLAPVRFGFSTLKLPNINKKIAAILHVTLTLLFDKVLLDY